MRVTEINKTLSTVEYAGEFFINLQELNELLNKDSITEMEDILITPYYIQDNKRMELYQYEFCCTNDCDFKDYILKITGKKRIEDVPKEILCLRKKCFATVDEPDKLRDYIKFLFENKCLQQEVEQVFGNYVAKNLYGIIY